MRWVDSAFYPMPETGIRPIQGMRDVAVLDRVVVDVIHATLEMRFVTHKLFPIAALPDSSLAFGFAALRPSFFPGQAA